MTGLSLLSWKARIYSLPMHTKPLFKYLITSAVLFFSFAFLQDNVYASDYNELIKLVGKNDSVLIADMHGNILFSKNKEKKLVPASILKIFTSLAALYYLGTDFRFSTEFYKDKNLNLKIKGYGDPLLLSENLAEISRSLAKKIDKSDSIVFNNIIIDDSYFKHPVIIPGVSKSSEPYDAGNGALCVNFNTVNFKKNINGEYISAEPETPLIPFAVAKIKSSGIDNGRITFSHDQNDSGLYAGHLLKYFLKLEQIKLYGKVKHGLTDKNKDKILLKYTSNFSLEDVIAKLLEFSNNFISNQLLIATGAKLYGHPGTLEKGVLAVSSYARDILKLKNFTIVEGSGISRKNSISAIFMYKTLCKFEPFRNLMRHDKKEYYKTGTLYGINTRAGYIENSKGDLYCFVVMINTRGKSVKNIMEKICKIIENETLI